MSKAFTKEDDETGFTLGPPSSAAALAWVSFRAAAAARDKLAQGGLADADVARLNAILKAPVVPRAGGAEIAVGAEVRLRGARGERTLVLTSAAEVGLVAGAVSTSAPLGRALVGAVVGDEVEVEAGGVGETYEVLAVSW